MALDHEEMKRRRARKEKERRERLVRQRQLTLRLIAAGAVLLVCGVAIFALTKMAPRGEESPSDPGGQVQATTEAPVQTEPEVTEPTTVIHIAAAGDLNVTDKTVAAGEKNGSYDYTAVFMDVLPLLAEADLTVLNFEGNLCGTPYGSETTSAPQEMMQALSKAGVDLVQMANSCSIDNGLIGLSSTLSAIRAAGMEPLGAYASPEEFQQSGGYTIRQVRGVKIAFVAFTKGMDNMGLPAGSEDCVNLLYTDYDTAYSTVDTDGITKILRAAAKESPDITVALLHWGSEYNDQISSTQKKILNLMYSEGVDVVLGTHSHYVQQMVLDEENNTFVAYSLGDFLGDAEKAGSNYSVVLDLEITKDNNTGITTITNYSYTSIFIQKQEAGLRVVRLEPAIDAYKHGNIEKVTEADYNDMVYALTRIEQRINPNKED